MGSLLDTVGEIISSQCPAANGHIDIIFKVLKKKLISGGCQPHALCILKPNFIQSFLGKEGREYIKIVSVT